MLGCAALLLSGCHRDRFPISRVSGQVELNGSPLVDARVCFSPQAKADDGGAGQASQGITDSEGRFELALVDGRKGAVVGPHRVIISMFKADERGTILRNESLPRRFNAATELTFDVPKAGTEKADFSLEADSLIRQPTSGPADLFDYHQAPE